MKYLDIVLPGSDGKDHRLSDWKGQKVVLYFYPKDNTPGCTMEAIEFTRLKTEYEDKGYTIIGVSKDSIKSHAKFIKDHDLNLLLLSDLDQELALAFGVIKPKSLYGKSFLGVERSTFLLDENGAIVKEFRGVNAKEHPGILLEEI